MYNLARARTDLLLSFVMGVGCTIIVQLTGMASLLGGALMNGAAQSEFSWLPSLRSFPPIGFGTLMSVGAVIALVGAAFAGKALSSRRSERANVAPPPTSVRSTANPIDTSVVDAATQAQSMLDQQLTDLLKVVVNYLARNSAYSAAVARVQDQLTPNAGLDRVRHLIEALVNQNAEALRDARSLRGQLESAREQASDIRERLHTAERLTRLDALTSVANRRSLEEFLEREVGKSHQDQSPLCVVMTDIDHFKLVNDTHGHQMGDDVLKSFAQLLQSNSRGSDLVARFGGEEFTLVLPRTPMGNAYQIADRVRRALDASSMNQLDGKRPLAKVSASFGIAEIRENEDAAQLMFRADRMLYEAKKNGRNLVVTDSLDRLQVA